MNSFLPKKKKYRFQVELRVEELQHVPYVNQELYVKVRLLEGGFTSNSQSLTVKNHSVRWDQVFKFSCKMTANASTGELDTCYCRVSVRQEVRGGRSFKKLGFVNVNLAQFAGCGGSQTYLLEAYNSRHRLHNSMLRVKVDMVLSSGDICFKAQPWPPTLTGTAVEGTPEIADIPRPPSGTGSVGSSLGYSSLDKKAATADDKETPESDQTGHSRNSSNTSGSGYVSNASQSDTTSHVRTGSQGSGESEEDRMARKMNNKDPRVVATREDPTHMIDQIFQDTIGSTKMLEVPNEPSETSGLQLCINEDGTAFVSGHKQQRRPMVKKR